MGVKQPVRVSAPVFRDGAAVMQAACASIHGQILCTAILLWQCRQLVQPSLVEEILCMSEQYFPAWQVQQTCSRHEAGGSAPTGHHSQSMTAEI